MYESVFNGPEESKGLLTNRLTNGEKSAFNCETYRSSFNSKISSAVFLPEYSCMRMVANFLAFFFDRLPNTAHNSLRSKGRPATYNAASNSVKERFVFSASVTCSCSVFESAAWSFVSSNVQFPHSNVYFLSFLILPQTHPAILRQKQQQNKRANRLNPEHSPYQGRKLNNPRTLNLFTERSIQLLHLRLTFHKENIQLRQNIRNSRENRLRNNPIQVNQLLTLQHIIQNLQQMLNRGRSQLMPQRQKQRWRNKILRTLRRQRRFLKSKQKLRLHQIDKRRRI